MVPAVSWNYVHATWNFDLDLPLIDLFLWSQTFLTWWLSLCAHSFLPFSSCVSPFPTILGSAGHLIYNSILFCLLFICICFSENNEPMWMTEIPKHKINSAVWGPLGQTIISGHENGDLCQWDVKVCCNHLVNGQKKNCWLKFWILLFSFLPRSEKEMCLVEWITKITSWGSH
jgi:hypothetical protein